MVREKCIRQLVQNVEKKLKSPSNQMEADPSIAGIVTKNANRRDFSKRTEIIHVHCFTKIFFYFFIPSSYLFQCCKAFVTF